MPRLLPRVNHLAIRFAQYGCTNRPFYHVVVIPLKKARNARPLEQIGSYDPMPNSSNEKLLAINFERFKYWMVAGAIPTKPLTELLGLAGYLPIHPNSYLQSSRNRRALAAAEERRKQEEEQEAAAETSTAS